MIVWSYKWLCLYYIHGRHCNLLCSQWINWYCLFGSKLAAIIKPTWYKSCDKLVLNHNTLNTLRPRQNGRPFPDDIFKCIFLNDNIWISNKISLKFVPKGPINNIPALVQIMAWRRPGDKPLSEPMMVNLPTHICVTRPQWVNNG